jgi:hypothetical protein
MGLETPGVSSGVSSTGYLRGPDPLSSMEMEPGVHESSDHGIVLDQDTAGVVVPRDLSQPIHPPESFRFIGGPYSLRDGRHQSVYLSLLDTTPDHREITTPENAPNPHALLCSVDYSRFPVIFFFV